MLEAIIVLFGVGMAGMTLFDSAQGLLSLQDVDNSLSIALTLYVPVVNKWLV